MTLPHTLKSDPRRLDRTLQLALLVLIPDCGTQMIITLAL